MTTLYTLTSTTALADLRLDLSDTNAASYRWTDAALNRAIDEALERYSWANPWMQATQLVPLVGQNIFPFPAGAFYIGAVEYPLGQWPKCFATFLERKSPLLPTPVWSNPSVSFAAGGALSAGLYQWAVTVVSPGGGETLPSVAASGTAGANQQATLGNIPAGPYGTLARNVYRTVVGGAGSFKYAGQIPDNTSGSFTDSLADAGLGAVAPAANTTQNLDQFEVLLRPELRPDGIQALEFTYATKHHLDVDGTTVPERHWQVLFLGAVAYAMWSYLPQVNDNFIYADGHLRDRVDDTASTVAWATQCDRAMRDFEAKLTVVKEESNAGITGAMAHWGDVPLRYERL